MKKYWLINVMGNEGYSMLVRCGAKTDSEAIDIALDAGLFDNDGDWKIAVAEEADDNTIKHFKEWKLIHEL